LAGAQEHFPSGARYPSYATGYNLFFSISDSGTLLLVGAFVQVFSLFTGFANIAAAGRLLLSVLAKIFS